MLLGFAVAAQAGGARAETIAEPYFGFAVALPDDMRHCETAMHVGIGFLVAVPLDPRDPDPCNGPQTRVIRLMGAMVDKANRKEWRRRQRQECAGRAQPPNQNLSQKRALCNAAPRGLHIGKIAVEGIRIDYPDERVRIAVFGYGASRGRTIFYLAGFQTSRASYTDDLKVFRRVLAGITVSAAQR